MGIYFLMSDYTPDDLKHINTVMNCNDY